MMKKLSGRLFRRHFMTKQQVCYHEQKVFQLMLRNGDGTKTFKTLFFDAGLK